MTGDPEWEGPYFKLLAKNDSGQAQGHQAGVVIPKEFDPYLPNLSIAAAAHPKGQADIELSAAIFFDGEFRGVVKTRYQYQTWGGARTPERRITGQLPSILNPSKESDIFLIERNIQDDSHFRLSVISSENPNYGSLRTAISAKYGTKRWGLLPGAVPFARVADVAIEIESLETAASKPFGLFDKDVGQTLVSRIARGRAFGRIVRSSYSVCAFCGGGFRTDSGLTELEAAHIVSRKLSGTDDPRNGLALCRGHHWAFDNGLIGVDPARTLVVSSWVSLLGNATLAMLAGKPLLSPANPAFLPDLAALDWHYRKIFSP